MLRDLFDLSGRVALVTGGSRGLGLQIAEALGEFGARIVLTARKPAELAAAEAHLATLGIACDTLVADHARPEAAQAVTDHVLGHHGRCDILVNNAGTSWGAETERHPLEAWQKVMDLNLTGLFLLTQAIGRDWMIPQRRGRIVNLASIAGLIGNEPATLPTLAYSTSKGGLISFTRALAAEWGQYGITVNAIGPGYFPSRMTKGVLAEHEELFVSRIPRGRLGGPEDLKGAALLLASDAGAHITGQMIVVDGGQSII
jgi:gluconate 5-dehydrogenase